MNVRSARKAAEFVCCCSFDDKERLTKAIVPGHEARLYTVTLLRTDGNISAQRCETNSVSCKGHRFGLCFHVLAAIICAADKKGLRLTFCATQEKAERIQRTGGIVAKITSAASGKGGWVVYRPKKAK